MEPPGIGINVALYILHNLLVVVLNTGNISTRSCQANDHPFAAGGANAGSTQGLHVIAGSNVRIADFTQSFQHGKLGFRSNEDVIVVNQQLLQVGQSVISLPCRLNVLFGVQGHIGQLVNEINDLLRLFLILRGGRQLCVSLFGIRKLLNVRNQLLLIRSQIVVSLAGRADAGVALFRNRVFNLINELDNLVGLQLIPLLGRFPKLIQFGYITLLVRSQTVITIPRIGNGYAAVDRNRTDLVNQIIDTLCFCLIRSHFQLFILLFSLGELLVVRNLIFFCLGQGIVSGPGSINFLLALVRIGYVPNLIDKVDNGFCGAGVLNGLTVFDTALLVVEIIRIMEDNIVSIGQILSRNAYIGMAAIYCVHPAGLRAVVKLAQTIHSRDIYGVVLVVVTCVERNAFLLSNPLKDIPNSFCSVGFHIAFTKPGR